MRKRITALILLFLVVFVFSFYGCSDPVTGGGMDIPRPDQKILDNFDPSLAGKNNEFGIKLFEKLLEEEEELFISPLSIAAALSMTYNGARGETKEAMAEVLEITGVDKERLNENNLALLYLLQEADPSVILSIANSLWMREGMEFNPEFVKLNERYYHASVRELDFNSPEAADTINRWVYDRTNGLIEDIIEPPISPLTILFLINAIHFQGDWTETFDEEKTREDTFYLKQGERVTVPFMHHCDEFYYYEEEEEFQAIRIPYGEEETMAMYVFLPHQDQDIKGFFRTFKERGWEDLRREFVKAEGNLYLPRFSMEYEKTLNEYLKALGMEVAFDEGRADFLDMVPWEGKPGLYISEVKHKSFIQVDEKGTEAAAATSVEITLESAPAFQFEMKVDRPFFFLIHEEKTDSILFMGSVTDPSGLND
ncbi:MAG: serpin family protein [Candidatus Syntrophonatronum acetioxidans]|uniref:Serpin family protein n=1 Tax=Candidatus Syntrophonatronum acetioxidans TaxID=1795816 RepID=A0A424YC68_9FIRM|nr:MAG: serpin family protein [Candidatus Syntrophonatronum acetioxidans]